MTLENQESQIKPLSWINGVCVHDGYCWATELVEVETGNSEGKRWDARPLCLGTEKDIVPIIKGQEPIPDDMPPRRRALLEEIMEVSDEPSSGARSIPRGRTTRSTRATQRGVRRTKKG